MNRHPLALVLVLASLGLSAACGGVYSVSDDPASRGVPFLPIVSVDVTSMTFEQRWAEVELSVTYEPDLSDQPAVRSKVDAHEEAAKKPAKAAPAPAPADNDARPRAARPDEKARFKTRQIRYLTDIAYANALLKTFNEESTPVAASEKLSLRFKNDPDKKLGLEEPAPLSVEDAMKLPLASVERRRMQVPGPKLLYMNVPLPPGGSGSAAIELNANGTLSKGSAFIKNDLFQNIGRTVGTVVSSIVGAPGSKEGAFGVPIIDARMRVTVVRRVYAVTLERNSGDATSCDVAALLKVNPVVAPPPDASACRASFSSIVLRGDDIDSLPKPFATGAAPSDAADATEETTKERAR